MWRDLLRSTEAIEKKSKRVRVLSSNAWLIPATDQLHIAKELCSEARKLGFQYEILGCGVLPKEILQTIDPFA
jgi:hypothetical protein